jgi:hypothetical protein
MRRRKEWFDKVEFYLVLWWESSGYRPSLEEAKMRLALLQDKGPTDMAFTFWHEFEAP